MSDAHALDVSDPKGGRSTPVAVWIIAGILVVAAIVLLVFRFAGDGGRGGDDGGQAIRPGDDVVWVFDEARFAPGTSYSLMALWPKEDAAPALIGMEWLRPRIGFYQGTIDAAGTQAVGDVTVTAESLQDEPRFARAGFNATRATLFAFDADGELLATTASLAERAHLPWTDPDFFFEIDDVVYYFGLNETAPDDTEPLPSAVQGFRERVLDVAGGLPRGGVASVVVPADEWAGGDFIGALYLTARIDELVYAP